VGSATQILRFMALLPYLAHHLHASIAHDPFKASFASSAAPRWKHNDYISVVTPYVIVAATASGLWAHETIYDVVVALLQKRIIITYCKLDL
jgi:hypothetical protein